MSTPSGSAIAAAAQLTSTDDLEANLKASCELAQRASDRGAWLFLLPECFCFLGETESAKFEVAENLDPASPGPILGSLMEMATSHRMWVAGAGIPERIADEPSGAVSTAYNTMAVVSPTGELAALYRKIHLFDVDVPGGPRLRESAATTAGREVVSVDTDRATLGLSICYDLRFPELYRSLVTQHDAHVLLVPAAFTVPTGEAHWHLLLRARAVESQSFVIAAGQVGKHNEKRSSYGHSVIIDPWGRVLDELEDGTGLAVAELDFDFMNRKRTQLPSLKHRVLSQ